MIFYDTADWLRAQSPAVHILSIGQSRRACFKSSNTATELEYYS